MKCHKNQKDGSCSNPLYTETQMIGWPFQPSENKEGLLLVCSWNVLKDFGMCIRMLSNILLIFAPIQIYLCLSVVLNPVMMIYYCLVIAEFCFLGLFFGLVQLKFFVEGPSPINTEKLQETVQTLQLPNFFSRNSLEKFGDFIQTFKEIGLVTVIYLTLKSEFPFGTFVIAYCIFLLINTSLSFVWHKLCFRKILSLDMQVEKAIEISVNIRREPWSIF